MPDIILSETAQAFLLEIVGKNSNQKGYFMVRFDKLVNALACSIATLEGTFGGYSPEERMQAKMVMMDFKQNLMLEFNHASYHKPDEISVAPQLFIGTPE